MNKKFIKTIPLSTFHIPNSKSTAGATMKLFLVRDTSDENSGFMVFNESAYPKYKAYVHTDRTKQKIIISDSSGYKVSEIVHKNLVIDHFSVRCGGRLYVLVPYVKNCFTFMIYGSTYRFAGDILAGRFSLFDVDKSPVMTQKKCWSRFGSGFELEIYYTAQEVFALSAAICAAMYNSASETSPLLSE